MRAARWLIHGMRGASFCGLYCTTESGRPASDREAFGYRVVTVFFFFLFGRKKKKYWCRLFFLELVKARCIILLPIACMTPGAPVHNRTKGSPGCLRDDLTG